MKVRGRIFTGERKALFYGGVSINVLLWKGYGIYEVLQTP
jgi:hypothetical protein